MVARAQERARVEQLSAGLALGALLIAVSAVVASSVARAGSLSSPLLTMVLTLAGAVILLGLRPEMLVLPWLALAPFLQESAGNVLGHGASVALYVAPPLVLALWTFTRLTLLPSLRFVDTLPAAFLIYALASMLLTTNYGLSSVRSMYVTIGIGVILYYFFAFGPLGSLSRENITGVLLLACTLEAVMGIVDGLTGWNLWNDHPYWGGGFARAVATLGNPAVLGAFVGMGVVLAVALLVWDGPRRLRAVAIATITFGLPAIFFTYTRAPILATVVGVVLVLATRSQARLIAIGSIVLAAVLLIASWGRITESPVYQERVTNTSNIQTRVLIQDWSLQLAAERPLFGWGYGSFDRVKNSAGLSSGAIPYAYGIGSTSHNTYLTTLVELGAIGLALFIVPWLTIIVRALKSALSRPELMWFVVGATAAIAVYALVATTLDMRFFSFVPALPWLFLGLLRRTLNSGV